MRIKSNIVFFLVSFCFFLVVLFLTYEGKKTSNIIHMKLLCNRGEINSLEERREIYKERDFYLDYINFPLGLYLKDSLLGEITDCNRNLFLEFDLSFKVKNSGIYVFKVLSDDGFRIVINDKTIIQDNKKREFKEKTVEKYLKAKKEYKMKVYYFQSEGLLGLKIKYRKKDKKDYHFLGIDSKDIKFHSLAPK